jgi:hypothetical protein
MHKLRLFFFFLVFLPSAFHPLYTPNNARREAATHTVEIEMKINENYIIINIVLRVFFFHSQQRH